jgi:hypothetical protein
VALTRQRYDARKPGDTGEHSRGSCHERLRIFDVLAEMTLYLGDLGFF